MDSYFWKYFFIGAISVFFAGCTTKRAEIIDPPQILELAALDVSSDLLAISEKMPNKWWDLFQDEQLSAFIETAIENNPTIHKAYNRILLAQANAHQVRSNLYPYLWFGADVSRQKLSKTGVIPFGEVSVPNPREGIPVYFTQTELNVNLKYDFDLWGKNRNTLKAALNEVEAQACDFAFAKLQLSIALARAYFQLQVDYKRLQNLQDEVNNLAQYVQVINQRITGNLDSAFLYHLAEYELSIAKQNLLRVQADIAINEIQLKTYLASDFNEEICAVWDQPLPQVPLASCLPLHLIANRPDIAAQLRVIQSAGNLIDVAKVAFYPDFNITALFGFQTIHLHDLFRWDSSYFNIDPAVTLPIFDAGSRLATLRKNEFNYDAAIFEYNQLILNAVKEVLEGIALVQNFEKQLHETQMQEILQGKNLKIIQCRVSNAIGYQSDIILAKRNHYEALDVEMIAYGNTLQAILSLIKALGGGFEI